MSSAGDGVYNGLGAPTSTGVTVNDDDTLGVTGPSITSDSIAEASGETEFSFVLDSEPTDLVTVSVSSLGSPSNLALSTTQVVFAVGNWHVAQTVTVVSVPNSVDLASDPTFSVDFDILSDDAPYDAIAPSSVTVTVTDDDTAGLTLTPLAVSASENGGEATVTVVLDTTPTSNVVVAAGAISLEVDVSSDLTFTSGNWNAAQTMTLTGLDDGAVESPDPTELIAFSVTSVDGIYNGIATHADVTITLIDDDGFGVFWTPSSATVAEASGSANFQVSIIGTPSSTVTVTPTTASSAVTLSAALVFTPGNAGIPQDVTATAVPDDVDVITNLVANIDASVASDDVLYHSFVLPTVSVTVTDDDTRGLAVDTSPRTVSEADGEYPIGVALTSKPSGDVVVTATSGGSIAFSATTLTFSPTNYATASTITATAVDDDIDSADRTDTVLLAVSGADATYDATLDESISFTLTDDDTFGVSVSTATLTTDENGGTATFTVVLDSEPTSSVTLSATGSAGVLDVTATLDFSPGLYSVMQTFTVTGVDNQVDSVSDAVVALALAPSSDDGMYDALILSDVATTITDDDVHGFTLSDTFVFVPELLNSAGTVSVRLDTEPINDVTLLTSAIGSGVMAVSPPALTFTVGNYADTQLVTVTSLDNDVAAVNVTDTLRLSPSSTDALYGAAAPLDVSVTFIDDDTADIVRLPIPSTFSLSENGATLNVTFWLSSEPVDLVTISFAADTAGEISFSPGSDMVFSPTNWATANSVLVTTLDDADRGNFTVGLDFAVSSGTDTQYPGTVRCNLKPKNWFDCNLCTTHRNAWLQCIAPPERARGQSSLTMSRTMYGKLASVSPEMASAAPASTVSEPCRFRGRMARPAPPAGPLVPGGMFSMRAW